MKVRLNGDWRGFEETEVALIDLLNRLGFQDRPVLVEHNGTALREREHGAVTVKDGDQLEIILIVAGG